MCLYYHSVFHVLNWEIFLNFFNPILLNSYHSLLWKKVIFHVYLLYSASLKQTPLF